MIGVMIETTLEMVGTTVVELSAQEAELFKQFRKHQELFTIMCQYGALDVKNGNVILSFDPAGVLKDIKGDLSLYHRTRREE